MSKTLRSTLIRCCILYAAWVSFSLYGDEPREKDLLEKDRNAFAKAIRDILPVTIHGRVKDQNGNAVADANVCISWTRWPLLPTDERNKTDWLETEEDGAFEFTCERPYRAFVDVFKDGYESPRGSSGDLIVNRTSKSNPIGITLRKKGPSCFLIVSPTASHHPDTVLQTKGTNSVSRPLDLLSWKSDPGWKHSATPNADLRIDAAFNTDKKCWNVTYSVTNGQGGIVLSDAMLYEAPADGYAPSVAVTVTNVYDGRRYLYVKSREPAVYSRVLFEHGASIGTNPSLRVSCRAWVNPYGDRSLEEDERVTKNNWRVREALTAESVAAIRSKRLPPKPDIAQRIKETNERVAREEAEKDRRDKQWLEQQNKMKAEKAE
ncbi:MAG: carboxypeptidase-like regulatory domain-containing protein [Kiritimatiellia bacterium]|jgi:hypothetical protein|nr:carboxypeptidase-like regulatory domain-containing protein [Kiritimatiellia bacterium]